MSHPAKRPLRSKEYQHTNHLMNPQRVYVDAASTDIAATFQRLREDRVKKIYLVERRQK